MNDVSSRLPGSPNAAPVPQSDVQTGSHAGTHPSGMHLEDTGCAVCGAAESRLLLQMPDLLCGIEGEFCIAQCSDCGHRFLNPRPVADHLVRCYPQHYGPHQPAPAHEFPTGAAGTGSSAEGSPEFPAARLPADRLRAPHSRPWYLRLLPLRYVPGLKRLYNWLLEDGSQPVPAADAALLPEVRAQQRGSDEEAAGPRQLASVSAERRPRALEIGCATGAYLLKLREHGWDVQGIEPADAAASIGRSAGLSIVTGTLDSSLLSADSFDLATAWMVLEHVPDPRDTLGQLLRLLRPGGQLMFSVPNAACWEPHFFGRHWYAWEPPRHLQHFSVRTLRSLLRDVGYEDVRVFHQRNLSYVVGSVGLWMLSRRPQSQLGKRLRDYPGRPGHLSRLLLAPVAHVLSLLGQGGRVTISARRPRRLAPPEKLSVSGDSL